MKQLPFALFIALTILVPGCGPNPTVGENADKIFKEFCKELQRCNPDAFFQWFPKGQDECVADYTSTYATSDEKDKVAGCDSSEAGYCAQDLTNNTECGFDRTFILNERCEKCLGPE